ncbi:CC_3452 family protein [Aurantiacibacter rhizosphaerae]|uniref:UrcA family protein n=1 Tax=Aurantiacibacter rhizosphaerae TaxID=2691582 RepID=A0A844XBB8_9SPHN|nr:hypothetical protein [Aurantiacibacter rhizosphaerae]MWV26918.1 hypothetical protein [Aurantiacibacter rhizosphaerae]
MTRFFKLAVAATLGLSAAAAPPLQARDAAPFFTAELSQPASESDVIAGGVVFRCEGTSCVAPRSRDRALRVCKELRRKVGNIDSFTAGGEPISDKQLARCNS